MHIERDEVQFVHSVPPIKLSVTVGKYSDYIKIYHSGNPFLWFMIIYADNVYFYISLMLFLSWIIITCKCLILVNSHFKATTNIFVLHLNKKTTTTLKCIHKPLSNIIDI